MLSLNRQSIRITLIGLGSILLILAINMADKTETHPANTLLGSQEITKPSAYLVDSTFNLFNAEGKLSKLHAAKAFFYKDQDAIKIENPEFLSDDINTSTLLTARNGLYHPSNESLLLEGDVIAKQTENMKTVWQLKTDKLNIDNKTGMLFTNEAVDITSGSHKLQATGITVSLNDRNIKLLSNVRGKYVFE